MHLPGIGPGGQPSHEVELSKKPTDDLVGISLGTQPIELRHDFHERLLDIADRAFRIMLALLIEAALALHEFFAVEIGNGMEHRVARGSRVGQVA